MTNRISTKHAFLTSLMALLLCFTMLLGTTYAWFTDSVTSAGNKIQAGTLDVQLFMHTENNTIEITNESAPIFGPGSLAQDNAAETLWEPGKTQVVYLSIKNNGSLALKYKVDLVVTDIQKALNEALVYTITPDAQYGDINADNWDDAGVKQVVSGINAQTDADVELAPAAEHYFALAVHMKEEAGNEYQDGSITFDMMVFATQLTFEEDDFDNQYDAEATFPLYGFGSGANENGYIEFALYDKAESDNNRRKVANVKAPLSALADPTKPMTSTIVSSSLVWDEVVVESDQGAQTFNISVTNLKENNDVDVNYEIRVGTGLTGVKFYHYGTEITDAYYDGEYIKFSSTGFSPFTLVYDAEPAEEGDSETTLDTTRPTAIVSEVTLEEPITWENLGGYYPAAGNAQQLDAVYNFKAPHTTDSTAANYVGNSAYRDWSCDYYVMLKSDTLAVLPEASITLGGNYGDWGWIGFDNPEVNTNEWIPLLGSVTESDWTYADVVGFVEEFTCGVGTTKALYDNQQADILNGAEFIVQLRLTNPDDETDYFVTNEVTYEFPEVV